jgi:signal transduction histidine kinase
MNVAVTDARMPDVDMEELADTPRRHALFRFVGRIDRRLVGLAALFGALENRPQWAVYVLNGEWLRAVLGLLGTQVTALLVVSLAAILMRMKRLALPRPLALAVAVLAGCSLAHAITLPLFLSTNPPKISGDATTSWTLYWFFLRHTLTVWGILAAAWYFHQRATERRARLHASELSRRRLDAHLIEARLLALQAQVEPHFLFNTLAHVRHLCKVNPPLAHRMLERFCDYLRAALPRMRDRDATLGSELALASAYLEVQRIRMGERLAVELAVADADRHRPFPPMMLATLVENAIKHGLNPLPEGGTVRVSSESTVDSLRVVVADSGRGFSTSGGTGIGLANIRGRLAALYGGTASVTLTPNLPRGIRATIEIPFTAPAQGAAAA